MAEWQPTQYPGVRYREHPTRKHNGKADRYFSIRYKRAGKTVEESVGWASNGMNAQKAANIRSEIVQNIKEGKDEQSLADKRRAFEKTCEEEARKIAIEKREGLTFGTLMDQYYLPWADSNKKRAIDDRTIYKNWLAKSIGDKPLKDISTLDLEALKDKMFEKGKADATVRHALCLVRQAYNKAIDDWKIWQGENPCKGVKFPIPKNARQRFLSRLEAKTILSALEKRSPQVAAIAKVSLFSGMRLREVVALKWADVDRENGIITVLDTKNNESRQVFINKEIAGVLDSLETSSPDQPLFRDREGSAVKWLSKTFGRVVKELGLNNGIEDRRQQVCFHTLRHTFASWAVMDGTPIYHVGKAIGHKTQIMTQRYAHLAPDSQRKAFDSVSRFAEENDE